MTGESSPHPAIVRRLILGPSGIIDPARDIALGPWCYRTVAYRGNWPQQIWLPDPFESTSELAEAAEISLQEALALLDRMVPELNRRNSTDHDATFWDVLLIPWLLTLVNVLYERQARVLKLLQRFREEPLDVEIAVGPERWPFADSADFFDRGVFYDDFNVWLFSEMIKAHAPPAWRMHEVTVRLPEKVVVAEWPWRRLIRLGQAAAGGLRFSRVYGASFVDRLFFAGVLAVKPAVKPGCQRPSPARQQPMQWLCDVDRIAWATLPACFDTLSQWAPKRVRAKSGKMGVYAGLSYDEREKCYAAHRAEKGEHIISSQHGGNYGNMLISPLQDAIEYRRGPFISWGWRAQGKYDVRTIPLCSPYLSKFRRSASRNGKIVFVGAFQHAFSYRLMSAPQPGEQADYVRDKLDFITKLSPATSGRLIYRPYLMSAGGFDDAGYVLAHFPELKMCKGALHPTMQAADLVIADHPGTTMNICLAAAIPFIAFWNRQHWPMCPESEPYFDKLRSAGILFDNGAAAARHINALGEDINAWWGRAETAAARQAWAKLYARTGKRWRHKWRKALWSFKG